MSFNSFEYAIFLPIVFMVYWIIPHRYRWFLLLVSSYYFYMSWNPQYVILIFATTLVSYFAAIIIDKQEAKRLKKVVLIIALIICLGLLFFFKYFNFISESIVEVLRLFTINLHPITLKILLPVGISFYTFQTLSYVIDVYRGDIEPEHHFGIYAAFISFFPQLVAGPIERTGNLLPQIKNKKYFDYKQATYGLKLMAWGFFKKLAIADVIAVYVDAVYSLLDTSTGLDLLIAIFFFTIQIYCDFSGYSDIAIGTAKLLGINLMTNFRSPYFSKSIKEFWSRWHISLSTWFRDYVYIPLGGNRCSKWRHKFNLLITFLISGLWHGANWTFVIWGGIHGLAQIIENEVKITGCKKNKMVNFITWIIVFLFCNMAWVIFRANSISDAWFVIKQVVVDIVTPSTFLHNSVGLTINGLLNILFSILVLSIYDFASLKVDVIEWVSKRKTYIRWIIYFVLVFYIILNMPLTASSFIYFQF